MPKIKIVLLVAVCALAFFVLSQIAMADKYQAVVNIKEGKHVMGINPTSEILDFGDLSKGAEALRKITLENNGSNKISVKILIFGEISGMIKTDKKNFFIESGKKKEINFGLTAPSSSEAKEYKGSVWIFKNIAF